jgi:hypothetical protein
MVKHFTIFNETIEELFNKAKAMFILKNPKQKPIAENVIMDSLKEYTQNGKQN